MFLVDTPPPAPMVLVVLFFFVWRLCSYWAQPTPIHFEKWRAISCSSLLLLSSSCVVVAHHFLTQSKRGIECASTMDRTTPMCKSYTFVLCAEDIIYCPPKMVIYQVFFGMYTFLWRMKMESFSPSLGLASNIDSNNNNNPPMTFKKSCGIDFLSLYIARGWNF